MSDEKKAVQDNLFGFEEPWKEEWKGMPEFVQNDLEPFATILVHFSNFENVQKFAALVQQPITMDTKSLWYPEEDFIEKKNKKYVQE
jgi:hypothetical protein